MAPSHPLLPQRLEAWDVRTQPTGPEGAVGAPITCLFVSPQVSGGAFPARSQSCARGQAGSAVLLQGLHVLQTPLPP
jgi:hypothetical protein